MKKMSKALSLVLAGSMVVSMLATGAFAADDAPTYSDVPASAAYSEAVEYLTAEKIMDGIGGGKFGPQDTVTRAMAVTVLGRMAKAEQVETKDFTDIVPNSWYSGYVGWAVENNIVQGDGKGHFMPNRMVTSEEMNLILSRYAKLIGVEGSFYDTGAKTVTRADMAQRLYTFYQEDVNEGDTPMGETPDPIIRYVDRVVYVDRPVPGETVTERVTVVIFVDKDGYYVNAAGEYVDPENGEVVEDRIKVPEWKPEKPTIVNEAMSNSSTTLPVRVQVSASGKAGCTADETEEEHAAHTSEGWIMGYSDRGVYTFKGVNYATARRFENPKPAQYGNGGRWSNLYSTNADRPTLAMVRGASSPQAKTNTVYSDYFGFAYYMTPAGEDMFGRESDCLNLNVWTDTIVNSETGEVEGAGKTGKPILVFMHGGGTDSDSATGLEVYEGRDFAEHNDIVFVTVNARLGTLGYSRDFTEIGGGNNLAVRDMLLSIEWIKENAETFGGDPNNITIAGQSGGGSKVGLLVASRYAEDNRLFNKVVAISASLGGSATTSQESRNTATRSWVESIKSEGRGGLNENSTDAQVLSYLQSVRTDELSAALRGYSSGQTNDGYIFDSNSVFTSGGRLSPRASQYDYLIGNTWSEMVGRDSIEVIQSNRYDRALAYMSEDAKTELLEAMRHGSGNQEWRGTLEEVKVAFDKVFPGHDFYDLRTLLGYQNGGFARDGYYNSSMQASAGQFAHSPEHHTYEYLMAYSFPYFGGTPVYHTGDLAFWFYSLGNVRYQIAGDEENAYKLADFASTALANFCKTGNPSVEGYDEWLPHEEGNLHCMIIDQNDVATSRLVDGDYGDELNYLMTMVRPVDPNAANRFPDSVNLANVRVLYYGYLMNVNAGDIDYENRIWTGELPLPAGASLVELVTDAEGNTTRQPITLVSASAAAAAGLDEEPAPEKEEVTASGEEEATAPEEEDTIPVNEPETPVEAEEPVPETEPVPEA